MPQGQTLANERVAILAITGRDALLIERLLRSNGLDAVTVPNVSELGHCIHELVGAAIITEESLTEPGIAGLREALSSQPPWSDLPLILLSTSGESRAAATSKLARELGPANVSLLERPLRSVTLLAAVEAALRSRRRQYHARGLYEDLERRVAERSAELLAKNRELEGFSYSVSHDMRAPLRAIVSRARIVLEEESANLSPDGVQHLERLAGAALKMSELVDDLLEYARIGTAQIRHETVDLGELAITLGEEIELKKYDCALIIENGDLTAQCDPRLMSMALLNLLDNARKYRRKGVPAEIRVGSTLVEGRRTFYVKDRGIGFDMAFLDKLFKPFERLHREEYPGTGIGLANVRRVIERHGGSVWAEGKPGEGSTFYFTLGEPEAPRG